MKCTKGLYLSIPTPCGENWDKMTDTAAGKHCISCDKTVIDFSLLTDAEIFAVINNGKGNVCGHFTNDQLGGCIPPPLPQRNSFIPAMLLTAGMVVSIANEGHAETRGLERIEMDVTLLPADTGKRAVTQTVDLPVVVVTGYAISRQQFTTGAVVISYTKVVNNNPLTAPVPCVAPVVEEHKKDKRKRWFFK
ncbi:hypothetical protein [Chitinophaga sp. MM2321]|uniref:hypothetical protein n=1 Tax=Chitinophaga sp. MM2321 TaxID=3137178 RepID=UPI0032D581F4